MSNGRRSDLSSAFDVLLQENRRALDGLFGGGATTPGSPSPAEPTGRGTSTAAPSGHSDDVLEPDLRRQLNDRFGGGWRYDVLERRRDGDEVTVLCKLIVDDPAVAKSQFGRANLTGVPSSGGIAGTAAGVPFRMAGGARSPAPADGETAAYRRAINDAVAKCVEML